MIGEPGRRGVRGIRALAGVGAVAALCAAAPPPASAGWGRPVRVFGPVRLDVTAPTIAYSSGGLAAIALATADAEHPSLGAGFVALRPSGAGVGAARRVPGARLVLDLAFAGGALEVLSGVGSPGQVCCGSAQVTRLGAGAFAPPQTIVTGLTGATQGRLLALGPAGAAGDALAVVVTARGLWVARARGAGRFGPARRLTGGGALPETVAAGAQPDGGSVVAWAEAARGDAARRILVAGAAPGRMPGAPRVALAAPTGHRVDELTLVSRPGAASLGWTESWSQGSFHSAAIVTDLGTRYVRVLSSRATVASGLAIGADGRGDELAAWKECSPAGLPCVARAALRPAGRGFGGAVRLGRIDPAATPQPALASDGRGLVAWIDNGDVVASGGRGALFGPRVISRVGSAGNLSLAFGPDAEALAAWTQGTAAPSLVASAYSAP